MKLDKQEIPRFKFTPEELFSCNPVIGKRIMKTERKILDFWKNLLQGELLENGIEITYGERGLYTLTKSIEIEDGVRLSSFIKVRTGYQAILHHEYSLNSERDKELKSLVYDWLFEFSKRDCENNKEESKKELEDFEIEI